MSSTIYDVARLAGVSVATVSRIVNESGAVSDKTASKVRDAIARLNFHPNALGRNLSTAKTKTVGIVLPSLSNPVFADAAAGINEVALGHGYTLMLTMTEYDRDREQTVVNSLLSYQPEGVILTVANPANSIALDILEERGIPHVLIYNQPSARPCPTMTVDNVEAGREVARTFISLGHTRFGMISGTFAKSDRAAARWEGFKSAVAEAGLPAPELIEIDFVEPELEGIVEGFKADPLAAPTALFCSNDLLAIATIGALGRQGINVPGDISVIGFDGISISMQLHPTLATVSQPSREMGREAMRTLLSQLSGQDRSGATVMPHVLRLGESAGPACKHSPADLQNQNQTTKGLNQS